PKDQRVTKNLVQLLIIQNKLDEAEKINSELLKANAKDAEGLIAKGQILVQRRHGADAIDPLQTAIKTLPDNAVAHYTLGMALTETNDQARAESEWREAVKLNPAFVDAHLALARVAIAKGDANELAEHAEVVIQHRGNIADGYLLRSLARSTKHDLAG